MSASTRDKVAAAFARTGNVSEVARELKLARGTVHFHLRKLKIKKPLVGGTLRGVKAKKTARPKSGEVKRFILTCAQNNTRVNDAVWENLLALKRYYEAELWVSTFTYNKNSYNQWVVKKGTEERQDETWYDERVRPYIVDHRVEIAPSLMWCGEMNILPTAEKPLTGFEGYTARHSAIFPHVKFAMESIATLPGEGTKLQYTTGTVTMVNYIQKKAGLKAQFHHCYGALLVEVDSQGRWFVRQLNADRTGAIYDLDICASGGEVTENHEVEAINWGDIHAEMIDPMVLTLGWGPEGMLETLRPKYQFFHDTVNFGRRNHHDVKNPHRRFELYINGQEDVEKEMEITAQFLQLASRDWCKSVVVDSNHDNALERWLREADYKTDPVNAIFFLDAQARKYRSIRDHENTFHMVEWALRRSGCPDHVRFLRQDEPFLICKGFGGGVECGMHGDLGPDGARGGPDNLSKMGRKANTGHTHSAGIVNGLYVAGTSSQLDLGYNVGPSSWSHSHIVTYKNGKRSIITIWKGAWRA